MTESASRGWSSSSITRSGSTRWRSRIRSASATAGLLFQTAANQVIAADGKAGLTRAALLEAVKGIDDFTAGGILGVTNVGGRVPTGCFVMMKVDGGKFVRAEPTGPWRPPTRTRRGPRLHRSQ